MNLAISYYGGEGVEKDLTQAIEWLTKAADQGYGEALFLLGQCYAEGEGVEKDTAKAKELYQKAVAEGVVEAQEALEGLEG